MTTIDIRIGDHEVVLKADILKKDIIPLSKLNQMKQDGVASEEALIDDPILAMKATDILIEVFVVSIDGKTDRNEVKEIVENMKIPEFGELTQAITANLQDFEKKSHDSSTSTKPSSTDEADSSQKNG